MIRTVLRTALSGASLFALTLPAAAHMQFQNHQSEPGARFEGVLDLPHGCDGAPTDTVRVTIPQGFGEVAGQEKDGWLLDESASAITWSGGSVPDDQTESFAFSGVFAADIAAAEVVFAVEQMCGDAVERWSPTVALTAEAAAAQSHENHQGSAPVTVGDLELSAAFTRATLPNAPVGGGYVTITNTGDQADRLIGARSSFSPDVQIHEMAVVGDVMQMSPLPEGIEIGAGETVDLAPGGLHLMFMQITEPFVEGETVPVTLQFEQAGEVEITLSVEAFGASRMSDHSEHEGH